VPLGDAVRNVAACPCARHHESLAAALAAAEELILQVTSSSEEVPPQGAHEVAGLAEEIHVATAIAPSGRRFLHVFTDLEAAGARSPEASFVSVAPAVAFRMSVADGNEGLLVSAVGGDEVIVTADGIARLLGAR